MPSIRYNVHVPILVAFIPDLTSDACWLQRGGRRSKYADLPEEAFGAVDPTFAEEHQQPRIIENPYTSNPYNNPVLRAEHAELYTDRMYDPAVNYRLSSISISSVSIYPLLCQKLRQLSVEMIASSSIPAPRI